MQERDSHSAKVAVILVNWNGVSDLLECLESLLKQDYPSMAIIVCDNGSTDDSLKTLEAWALGTEIMVPTLPAMSRFSSPHYPKPLTLSDQATLQFGKHSRATVHLIKLSNNNGFAAGNNAGLKRALEAGADYFWVLNTDTVQRPDALSRMVRRLQDRPMAGLCGSSLCFYDAPQTVQEMGGCEFYPLLGIARRIAGDKNLLKINNINELERRLDYVSGASCLVSRDFLTDVGYMSEDYFLFCEEIDWATRARDKFDLALAVDSVVYHKKGRTTGSKSKKRHSSDAATFYLWRARRRFLQKFYPMGLIGLVTLGLASALSELFKGNTQAPRAIFRGLLNQTKP